MANEFELKKQICEISKRIYDAGMVAASDGSISVKLNDNEFLCTPTGVSKGFITSEHICKVDRDGKVIQLNGKIKPSSEIKIHMSIYKKRPDISAVIHAYPKYATGFAIAGIPLTQPILAESIISLGCVPVAEYGTSSEQTHEAVSKYLQFFDAVLLENNGALTYAENLLNAYHKMESVEFYANLLYISKQLGGQKKLSQEQVQRLYEIRRQLGMKEKHPADLCLNAKGGKPSCHGCSGNCKQGGNSDLAADITRQVMARLGIIGR